MRARGQLLASVVAGWALLLSAGAAAQVTVASLEGTVRDKSGTALPGVIVTATLASTGSSNTTVSQADGGWKLLALRVGFHVLTFELGGYRTVERDVALSLGQTLTINVVMEEGKISESISVVSESTPLIVSSSSVSETYFFDDAIAALPTLSGNLVDLARLTPGLVSSKSISEEAVFSVSGAWPGAEMVVDGMELDADLIYRGAIGELRVLTSGLPADLGGSPGLVDVVTRSGTNDFRGSLSVDLVDPGWSEPTPFERAHALKRDSDLAVDAGAFLGGPIVRDRAFFFVSGRREERSEQGTFSHSALRRFAATDGEGLLLKLDANVTSEHFLSARFESQDRTSTGASLTASATPSTLRDRRTEGDALALTYDGVLRATLFTEVRVATLDRRRREGQTASRFEDSPFLNLTTGPLVQYHAPAFDAADPAALGDDRLSGYLSWLRGDHDVKVGFEARQQKHRGGLSPSSTDFILSAAPRLDAEGRVVVDAAGRLVPVFEPGSSLAIGLFPGRGARIDDRDLALYVSDSWQPRANWFLSLGLRYEATETETDAAVTSLGSSSRLLPRLGASWDVRGRGDWVLKATLGRYAMAPHGGGFLEQTALGRPLELDYVYAGPAGQGYDFAPAFDPTSYRLFDARLPGQNVSVAPGTDAPVIDEATFSIQRQLMPDFFLGLTYVFREFKDLLEDTVSLENGTSTVTLGGEVLGTFDNVVIGNSDLARRRYQSLQLEGRYRGKRFELNGNWTWRVENEGNFEPGAASRPTFFSALGDYPGVFSAARAFPGGRLADGSEHQARLWGIYSQPLGDFGELSFAAVVSYDSGAPFSLVADDVALTDVQRRRLEPFASPPRPEQNLFFGDRGRRRFDDTQLVDVAVTYTFPQFLGGAPWLRVEILNAFGEAALRRYDTEIRADSGGPLDESGLPTTFIEALSFGQATGADSYVRPRTFQIALGFRF